MPVRKPFAATGVRRRGLGAFFAAAGTIAVMIAGAATPAAASSSAAGASAAAQALAPPSLFVWGGNPFGDLGIGSSGNQEDAPISLALPGAIRQIASGSDYTHAAVLTNGTVATWGGNMFGQIGDGTTTERDSPYVVPGLTGITQVAIGEHALALDTSGTVWSWGDNNSGQLGNGTTSQIPGSNRTPVPIPGLTGVIRVVAGDYYSLALRSDGTVWAWGENA